MSREIDSLVNNVNSQLDAPDKRAEQNAYQLLADEIHNYSNTHSTQDAAKFTNDVIDSLDKNGSLQSISVGWVRAHYKDMNQNRDIGVSQAEITRFAENPSSPQALLNSVLADRMLHRNAGSISVFDDVANRSPKSLSGELIEKSDLRAFGRQERREDRRAERHDYVRDVTAKLFEGKPCLMEVLDASGNGTINGRVSERDMRRFLVACDVNDNSPNANKFPYTNENRQLVEELLNGVYPEVTGPNFTGFSAEALSRRAGLDHIIVRQPSDYDTLVGNYQKVMGTGKNETDAEPPAEPTEPPAAKDKDDAAEKLRAAERARQLEIQAAKETEAQLDDMSTLRKGEGYWHVSKRLLNAGFAPDQPASDQEINQVMRMMMQENHARMAKDGMARPMVHPNQVIEHKTLFEMSQKVPRLGQSIENLYESNRKKLEQESD